jgi:hypothetical protein
MSWGPSRFIDKGDFIEDMRFYKKLFKCKNILELMQVNEFENYLYDAYGKIYPPDLWDF